MQNQTENKKTIVLTGGHGGSTAYAFVQALNKNKHYDWNIHFIGSKSAIEGKEVPTLEAKSLPHLGVKYHSVVTGRIQRRFTRFTLPALFRIPVGIWQTFKILRDLKPNLVLSFGGYTAFPVVFLSRIMRVPILIHEQTTAYGRANKLSEKFADKILLSREESLKFYDSSKSIITGNPIIEEVAKISSKSKKSNPPTIFVTGGSRGSEIINQNLLSILPTLLRKYKVIHQVGSQNENYFKEEKEKLGDLGRNYQVFGLIDPKEWPIFLEKSDIIVSRSGANIVSEIMTIKRPSLLIPIPWSFADEQTKNALFAKKFGIAEIITQESLNPSNLYLEIERLNSNWNSKVASVKDKNSPDILASQKMVEIVLNTLK